MLKDVNSVITRIEQLQELLKSYYIFSAFDPRKAAEIRAAINRLRLNLAVEAEMRQIYYQDIPINQNVSGYQENYFFTRGDTKFTVVGGVANLTTTALISLLHQGRRQNVLTRENTKWQALFSGRQSPGTAGQQSPFNFDQELFFDKNQSLQIGVTGQTGAGGVIHLRGCNIKDDNPPNLKDLTEEIEATLPQWQIVPLTYFFPAGTNTALDVSGNENIFSVKSDRSTLLTHVSISNVVGSPAGTINLSLYDDGRSQVICDNVPALGIAGHLDNPYDVYYPLPYPHLLRKQDRMRAKITGGAADESLQYLTFWGFAL